VDDWLKLLSRLRTHLQPAAGPGLPGGRDSLDVSPGGEHQIQRKQTPGVRFLTVAGL